MKTIEFFKQNDWKTKFGSLGPDLMLAFFGKGTNAQQTILGLEEEMSPARL
jgi:hypothetical protein